MPIDVDRYLERIRAEGPVGVDLDSLARLQRAHMTWVAFENLDVFHRVGVTVDPISNVAKIVDRGCGGWCSEVNGAFAELLTSIGFHVRLLGAAVLLDGPNDVVDHLTLEVRLDDSFLVDVGFGESFWRPLRLNTDAVQDGGAGQFALFPSPKGTTLTSVAADGGLVPQYRFKRESDHGELRGRFPETPVSGGWSLGRQALRHPADRWWSSAGHTAEGSAETSRRHRRSNCAGFGR